ncbi:hypothetical protein AAF712_011070 [Marasmius tenuissimus]|uniref:GATA-type domain-containing protein n=1 Tax=Marasmius tenuissimus TaxID=585030 RepID=A0ABR2ZK83_9AGAR
MLSDALRRNDVLERDLAEEKRRASYWEGMAKSYKVVEEVYGRSNGTIGSPTHSPNISTSTTGSSTKQAPESYPPAILDLIENLNRSFYEAECAKEDEMARRIAVSDLWRQLREHLDELDRRAKELKVAFDTRVQDLNNHGPIDATEVPGGITIESKHPPTEVESYAYDDKGRMARAPAPGPEPLYRLRGPGPSSPFSSNMGPPPLPPFSSSDDRNHRKRRSGSMEGRVTKKSRQYPPPPAPIHPPSHPSQFNPLTSGSSSTSAPNHSSRSAQALPPPSRSSHSHAPLPSHIPPPPPSHQPYADAPHGQGQFVSWAPSGQSGSTKQPPPPPQGIEQPPLYTTFSTRERERGSPSSLPRDVDNGRRGRDRDRDSRDRSGSGGRRRRERSRSESSDKSLDDLILDATGPNDQPGGNQLPPIRYGSTGNRRSSRERSLERGREHYHQQRTPPQHYLPPPGSQKGYPPPPMSGYRDVYAPRDSRDGGRTAEGILRVGENGQGDPHHPHSYPSSHGHPPHALAGHATIPNVNSLSSIQSASLVSHSSSHTTLPNTSSHPSIPAAHHTASNPGSQSSIVQPGSFPPTNAQGQRICRQCGQAGRYKEGKCVEKWGPGPHGPGTVCDRCRKKMKRVERRGTIEQAQAVAAAQAQQARQQAAMQARAEAARLSAGVDQRERLDDRERGRVDERRVDDRDRRILTRGDTLVGSSADLGGGTGSYRRDRDRDYPSTNGRGTPSDSRGSSGPGELAPPRTIISGSGSYRASPLPPRSPSRRGSPSHRSGSGGEDVDVDAEGDIDDGDGEAKSDSPETQTYDEGDTVPHHLDRAINRSRSRGGSGGSTASRSSGHDQPRRARQEQEDPEAELLEAVDAAEQSVKSE